jgi:hypothetical protein
MDLLGLMSLTLAIVCSCLAGIIFIIYKIVEEERERAEKEAMVKVHYKHYKKDGTCSECGFRKCQCEWSRVADSQDSWE